GELGGGALEFLGQISVVAVEKGDQRRPSGADAGVARSIAAAVFAQLYDLDAQVAERFGDGHAPVGRAVVDDDQLERVERLIEDTLDCAAEHVSPVVDGQDDRNRGGHATEEKLGSRFRGNDEWGAATLC